MGRLLLLLTYATIAFAGPAFGYCPPEIDYSVKAEFQRSAYVVDAKAVRVTWLDEDRKPVPLRGKLSLGDIPGGFDPYMGAFYRLEVLHTYKGARHKYLTIFSENTVARTALDVGARYLLFIHREKTRGDYYVRVGDLMIDSCGNSVRAEKAGTVLGQLPRR